MPISRFVLNLSAYILGLVFGLASLLVSASPSTPSEVVVPLYPSAKIEADVSILANAGEGLSSPASKTMPVLKVATGEWSPYVSESFPHNGALAHVISLIYAEAGIDVQYAYFPWPRGYQMVKDGLWHATMPYYCSPEREEDFFCSAPIVNGQQVFFYHVDRPFQWEKFEDLKGLNIGATLGYFYGETFEEYELKKWINVQRVARDDSNFKVLMRGRISAFPQDLAVGYSMIRQIFDKEEQKKITHHPKPIHTKPLHLIFPRNNPDSLEYLHIFNDGIKRMRADGSLQKYLKAMREGKYESSSLSFNEDSL